MLVAMDISGLRKVANDAAKGCSFTCPECSKEVSVRLGGKRVPHFAHLSGQACNAAQIKAERARAAALKRTMRKIELKASQGQHTLLEELEALERA